MVSETALNVALRHSSDGEQSQIIRQQSAVFRVVRIDFQEPSPNLLRFFETRNRAAKIAQTRFARIALQHADFLVCRREFRLQMTVKGKALYEELIPQLLRREQEILSCLSAQERKDFAVLLGKIEKSLDLVQTGKDADAKEAY